MKNEILRCTARIDFICRSKLDLTNVLQNLLEVINCKPLNKEVVFCDVDPWNAFAIYSMFGKEEDWYLSMFSSDIDTSDPDIVSARVKHYEMQDNNLSCLIDPIWKKYTMGIDDFSSVVITVNFDFDLKDVYMTICYNTAEECDWED